VVELFGTRDIEEARRLALHLDTRNRERKEVQQQIVELAITEWKALPPSRPFLCGGNRWGRLASRSNPYCGFENCRTHQSSLRSAVD